MSTRRLVTTTLVLLAVLLWTWIPGVPYDALNTSILAFEYLIVALSLVLLIGMVGQISLCQAALVGMGAFVSAIATKRFGIDFPFTLIVGLVAGAATAAVIGVVALRVRGLYLAVATLIFAYVADQYLFTQPWLVESQSGTSIPPQIIGKPGTFPSFDLANAQVFYYVALAVGALCLFAVANLRESRLGRAFAAIRGSEIAAASLGVNVSRFKLLGFACAGALAGVGGALTLVGQRAVAPEGFNFMNSLYFLSIAVVGGLRSLGGALASSVLFALLVGELFFRSPKLADYLDLISSGLLIAVLLFFRGGLGAVPERIEVLVERIGSALRSRREQREASGDAERSRRPLLPAPVAALRRRISAGPAALRMRLARRLPAQLSVVGADNPAPHDDAAPIDVVSLADRLAPPPPEPASVMHLPVEEAMDERRDTSMRALLKSAFAEGEVAGTETADGRREPVLLSAENITVRFGGLTAVNDASLRVCAGEIVGLIGPNGAGKTTMFNALLGLNQPAAGTVALFGRDVSGWPVHERAALGVGRTFQILQLFGDLTVFDNLLVATHLQNHTGLWGSVVASGGAKRAERAARERVDAVLRLMQLDHLADRRVAGLPFGILRLIEVARTLVTGARLVCFDEPASGLDSAETERLIEWFRLLRQIGITLLVIEHDVAMVTRLCDYIYVLDQGRLLAEGTPVQIQRDPAVIASYLGTSEEVVA